MAINFEAANMAGYNNPKIEVFKAVVNLVDNTIISAPSKTEIKSCLNRGAIPAIMCTSPDGNERYLLWLSTWEASAEGDTIMFSGSALTLAYTPDSEQPVVATG